MIEARWYDSLVMSFEEMGAPFVLDTKTDDIVEADAIAYDYGYKSPYLETDGYVLYRNGERITEDEIIATFEERYPDVE